MNLGGNIYNAFDVVVKTYENVNKLIEYCRVMATEKGEFTLPLNKTLHYKPDGITLGFISLFQDVKDELLDSGWRNGPIYILNIHLYGLEVYDVPMVNIAKYEYSDIRSWTEGWSQSNYWRLYDPLYISGHIDFEQEDNLYSGCVVDIKDADDRFWGLRRITGMEMPLTEITSYNAYEKIFGGFRSLADK